MASLTSLLNAQEAIAKPAALKQYDQYTTSLAKNVPETGFLEFTPRDAVTQSKYDAMQSSWQGVASSDKAIASGVYSLDYASANTRELRKQQPTLPQPQPKQESWCSIS
jgi:hypothetical protein